MLFFLIRMISMGVLGLTRSPLISSCLGRVGMLCFYFPVASADIMGSRVTSLLLDNGKSTASTKFLLTRFQQRGEQWPVVAGWWWESLHQPMRYPLTLRWGGGVGGCGVGDLYSLAGMKVGFPPSILGPQKCWDTGGWNNSLQPGKSGELGPPLTFPSDMLLFNIFCFHRLILFWFLGRDSWLFFFLPVFIGHPGFLAFPAFNLG